MHPSIILALTLALSAAPAVAQVTIDLRALDPLPRPGSTPQRPPPAPLPRPAPAPRPPQPIAAQPASPAADTAVTGAQAPTTASPATASSAAASPGAASPAATSPAAASQVTLPIVTPPAADIPPVPGQAAPAPSSGTPSAPAPADLRLAFDAGGTELKPDAAAAIKRFASAAAASDAASFNVVAYAAGKPEDPSTARRLSLSRALAVRSALMAEGVTSSRIYVRALGAQAAGGPPDRVDISALGSNAAGGANTGSTAR